MSVILFLSFIPVVIWATMLPLSVRFYDLSSITTSLGQIAGLLGMTLFSINLILAGRFRFLDKHFNGLDKVYAKHHLIGATTFSLLLFHPLLLVVKYIIFSLREAALFFVPFIDAPITWGIISLLLMSVLIYLTFYFKIKYHKWKVSHKFMVLVFIFAMLHTIYIPSDVSRNNFLRWYVLTLGVVGLTSGIRRAVLSNQLVSKAKYVVEDVKSLSEGIVEVEMSPVVEKLNFRSGQFIFISFKNGGISSEAHPFSISSGECDKSLKITVKALGDFTSELKNLKIGSIVEIEGAYGNFSYENIKTKNQIWIAGGIGITPFVSMARSLREGYKIDLYYSVKDQSEAVLLEDLQEIASNNKNFKINLWCSAEKGFINAGLISNLSGGLENRGILMCGPAAFMEDIERQLVSLKVNKENIYYEKFNFI